MATKTPRKATRKTPKKVSPIETAVMDESTTEVTVNETDRGEIRLRKSSLMIAGLLVLVLLGLFWYKTNSWPVAALVNNLPISRFEVDQELYKQGGSQVLDNLITDRLVQSALTKSNLTASDTEVNARIDEIKASLGSSFEMALSAQGLTEDQLKTQVATQIKIEKLLNDQATASAEEIAQAAKDNELTAVEAEKMVKQQKLQTLIQTWVEDLRAQAKIVIVGQKLSR